MESGSKRIKKNNEEEPILLSKSLMNVINKAQDSEKLNENMLSFHRKRLNDNAMPELFKSIEKLGAKVKKLDLSLTHLSSIGASMLFNALNTSTLEITEINLLVNKIGNEAMESLGLYIQSSKSIECIDLGSNKISDKGIEILNKYMNDDVKMKEIKLGRNDGITDASVPILMGWIEITQIEKIDVKNTSINQPCILEGPLIVKQRLKNEQIEMDLGKKDVTDDALACICKLLKKPHGNKVKKMILDDNGITSKGASKFFDTLRECNSTMSMITLNRNYIDDTCMKSLGEYIQTNLYIMCLYFAKNKLSDKGIEILSEYLIGNTIMQELNLSENKDITSASIPRLLRIIESSCFKDINIDATHADKKPIEILLMMKNCEEKVEKEFLLINDDDMVQICNLMKKYGIERLKEINLGSNFITSKGASLLFGTLRECNSKLSKIMLSNDQLNNECMGQLGEYLQNDDYLEYLDIAYNNITDDDVEVLSEYLIGNSTLKEVILKRNEEISDKSGPFLINIAKTTCIIRIDLSWTAVSQAIYSDVNRLLSIPIEQRELPIKSKTKSAANRSSSRASSSSS